MSPRKTVLERAKTFDLFASQEDGGEYIAIAVIIIIGMGEMYTEYCSFFWFELSGGTETQIGVMWF